MGGVDGFFLLYIITFFLERHVHKGKKGSFREGKNPLQTILYSGEREIRMQGVGIF
jgi:hypothetical protein